MTDGTIFLFPAPGGAQRSMAGDIAGRADSGGYAIHSETMLEAKGFNAHDGTAMSLARLGGLKTAIITKRISETVRLRARDLKIDHVYQGTSDKKTILSKILGEEGLRPEEAAYVGDNIIDLPAMRACGLAIATANARDEVKAEAHYTTPRGGGHGAVRDAIEYILIAQRKLPACIAAYLGERGPATQNLKSAPRKTPGKKKAHRRG